ncbi:MAG: hypothetical protein ACP5E5_13755 [Acidobacteriaceae bacterium]
MIKSDLNYLLGGWNISAITGYSNGGLIGIIGALCTLPYSGTCYADSNPAITGPVRINGAYGSEAGRANGSLKTNPVPYININAFQEPAPYTYGTTPRDESYGMRGIGGSTEDLSVDKTLDL